MSSMQDKALGIIGLGTLGQAVATLARRTKTPVLAYARSGSPTALDVELADSSTEVVERCRWVFFALPAPAFDEIMPQVSAVARGDHRWLHASKGVNTQGQLVHEIMRQHSCVKQIGVLGGPIVAAELIKRGVAQAVVASRFDSVIKGLEQTLRGQGQKLYRSHDLVGVEVAGALRNVISIAAGMCDGLGEAARSTVLSRGLIETARLATRLGAEASTFVGVAGVGDLIARRASSSSRNFQLGERCARGEKAGAVLSEIGTPEGAIAARAITQRAAELNVDMPLTRGVAAVLNDEIDATAMIEKLLAEDPGLGAGDNLIGR